MLKTRGVHFHVHFMSNNTSHRPSDWSHSSQKIYFKHSFWPNIGPNLYGNKLHTNPGFIKHILKKSSCPLDSFYNINKLQIQISSEVDINKISDLKIKYPHIWAHIENHRKNQKNVLQEIFLEASEMSYLREELDASQVARLYMNIINRTFQPEFFIQEEISLKDTVVLYIDIMSKGIFTKEALLKLNRIRENDEL